jgi:hypothetical protein
LIAIYAGLDFGKFSVCTTCSVAASSTHDYQQFFIEITPYYYEWSLEWPQVKTEEIRDGSEGDYYKTSSGAYFVNSFTANSIEPPPPVAIIVSPRILACPQRNECGGPGWNQQPNRITDEYKFCPLAAMKSEVDEEANDSYCQG